MGPGDCTDLCSAPAPPPPRPSPLYISSWTECPPYVGAPYLAITCPGDGGCSTQSADAAFIDTSRHLRPRCGTVSQPTLDEVEGSAFDSFEVPRSSAHLECARPSDKAIVSPSATTTKKGRPADGRVCRGTSGCAHGFGASRGSLSISRVTPRVRYVGVGLPSLCFSPLQLPSPWRRRRCFTCLSCSSALRAGG